MVFLLLQGRLPQSSNIEEYKQNLMNGIDMVTEGGSRWTTGIYGLPRRFGTIKDLDKFDASFFGVHSKQANVLDPQLRLLLESTYEAIVDAGINPSSIRGTRVGVFVGASTSESDDLWTRDADTITGAYVFRSDLSRWLISSAAMQFQFQLRKYRSSLPCCNIIRIMSTCRVRVDWMLQGDVRQQNLLHF